MRYVLCTLAGMAKPSGFEWTRRKDGEVVITHMGHNATVLRGQRASKFIRDVESRDAQELMARMTGNYRRGNERRS